MASKTKVTPQKEEMPEKEGPETSPDGPLLDLLENRRYGFGAAAHIIAQVARWQGREVFAFTSTGDVAAQAFARKLPARLGRQLRGEAAGAAQFRSHLGTGRSAGSSRAKRGAQGWPRRLRRYPHERYSGFSVPAALGGAGTSLGRQSHAK